MSTTTAQTDADDVMLANDQVEQAYYAMPPEFFEGLRIPVVDPNEPTKLGAQVGISVFFFSFLA